MCRPEVGQSFELRREGQKHTRVELSFCAHFAAYMVVNTLLVFLNLLVSPDNLWFYKPLLGWGTGLAAHGIGMLAGSHGPRLRSVLKSRD